MEYRDTPRERIPQCVKIRLLLSNRITDLGYKFAGVVGLIRTDMVEEENGTVQHISAARDQPHPVRRPIRSFSLGITQPEENSLRRDIHPDCDLLGRHAAVGKAAADRLHVFSDLDDVSVGIIEAHDALTPGMLLDRVDIADILSAQPLGERVKVVLLEVQLDLVKQAGGIVEGVGICIEKGFQGGGDELRASGIDVKSLAIIEKMDAETGTITFR